MPALLPLMSRPQVNFVDAEAQREARNTSAFAIMLGEFRTSLSDLLFIKTERYLDRGVGYEPHVNTRAMASSESASHDGHDHGAHDEHDHAGHDHTDEASAKTLIKSAGEDFRGFIGNLEREVKPWRKPGSPHDHAEGKAMSEVLPWYRLATLSNPHDVRNYYIGAWWLKTLRTNKQREEAIKFLNEGINANPGAYELYLMKGFILKESDQAKAARDSFRRSAELGINRRPPGGSAAGKDPNWDVTNDEQLNTAIGMDVMLTRDLETTETARRELHRYKEKMPDEGALTRMEHVLDDGN
jgi:hypothetical protein